MKSPAFLLFLFLLSWIFSSVAVAQGVVFSRTGFVQVNGRAVEAGDVFRSASVAETEAASTIRVVIAESSFVHAGPKTKFSANSNSDSTAVNLEKGWIWVRAGADRMLSVTAGGFKAEAQGADFIFRSSGSPRVLVLEGTVRVSDGAKTQVLDGTDVSAKDMPMMSELSTGVGVQIAVERKFLYEFMVRLKAGANGLVAQGSEIWSVDRGILKRASLKNEVLDGPFATFHGDGKPESMGLYKAGLKEGPWSEYYENGQLADEGEYRSGRRFGVWKFYSPSGKLIRTWNFTTDGERAVPRWQWGLGYSGAFQKQGDYHSAVGMITRCLFCGSAITPRFDVAASWLKFQEESSGASLGAHLGLDFNLHPFVVRIFGGAEYLVKDPVRVSAGFEITRSVGRDLRAREWQPFIRLLQIEMGKSSDIVILQVGLWESF